MEHDFPYYAIPSSSFFNSVHEAPLLDRNLLEQNIACIEEDIRYLDKWFSFRLANTGEDKTANGVFAHEWPNHDPARGPYASACKGLNASERALLLLSLLPHFAPEVLREIAGKVQEGLILKHPHIGGYVKRTSLQFIPSLQTVLFLCSGTDKASQQISYREIVMQGSLLKRQIITLRPFDYSETIISDKELIPELAEEYVQFFLQGRNPRPDFGKNFPAKLLVTDKTWEQLILNDQTQRQLELMIDWISHGQSLTEETKGYFGQGYPALFFGPPGTGKSLAAALIGKRCGLNVFRVDASRIVSKYIGETEKNLVQLFERMKVESEKQDKKPILFFDEADVLFSKRTEVKDAKDKWANMETSVLLPLIEEYEGLAIIATNFEHNLDDAMDRRFQLKVKFPSPAYKEKLAIWQNGLPPAYKFPTRDAAEHLARYKLSPASIMNILKGSCLQARKNGTYLLSKNDLELFLTLEFAKYGLTPSWEKIPGNKSV